MQLIPSETCNPPPHPPLTHSDRQEGLNRSRCVVPKVDKFVIHTTTYKESSRHRSDKPQKHASPTVATRYPMRTAERQRGGGREGSHSSSAVIGSAAIGSQLYARIGVEPDTTKSSMIPRRFARFAPHNLQFLSKRRVDPVTLMWLWFEKPHGRFNGWTGLQHTNPASSCHAFLLARYGHELKGLAVWLSSWTKGCAS